MKIIIILFVISISLMYNPLNCQDSSPCGENLDCSEAKTTYRYCNGDKIVTKCVLNPYKPGDQNLTLMRIPPQSMPICLNFVDSGPDSVKGIIGCRSEQIAYVKSDFEDDMKWSLKKWLCLCGLEDNDCKCEIDIQFSDNVNDFINAKKNPSSNTLDLYPAEILNGNCEIDCSKLKIFLNNTYDYCGVKDPSTHYDHFFVSSSKDVEGGVRGFVNLKSVILYQLAHIFGFGFTEDHDECFDEFGIMNSSVGRTRMYQVHSGPPHEFTTKDKCSFMKLYCPDLAATYVNDESKEKEYKGSVFNDRIILYFETNNYSGIINIELYNLLGRKVANYKEYNIAPGRHSISINSENLTSGIYFATIKSLNYCQIKKIIINR